MSNLPHADVLEKLRADLSHFDETGNFGDNPSIIAIREHLLRRIAELEAALRQTAKLETEFRTTHFIPYCISSADRGSTRRSQ